MPQQLDYDRLHGLLNKLASEPPQRMRLLEQAWEQMFEPLPSPPTAEVQHLLMQCQDELEHLALAQMKEADSLGRH